LHLYNLFIQGLGNAKNVFDAQVLGLVVGRRTFSELLLNPTFLGRHLAPATVSRSAVMFLETFHKGVERMNPRVYINTVCYDTQ
jgi:hypothetical protein